ncbi:PH domain-containing protein [Bacillus pumilus]|uniref:PH domain-containing protein n=1 Tax=Bacillus pumilus TaxID=1408 RepID=UPI00227FBF1C|nr:PH domain-containing protein [Bacillus pumilus]MCY7574462.1 PH domain-containing protein [Bacillus pumilus]
MAFIFRDEKIYNPVLQKKKNASKNFINLFHAANALLNQTNETIMEIVSGGSNFTKFGEIGLLIATKKRLIFIDKNSLVKSWNYSDVSHVSVPKKSWTGYKFSFNVANENIEVSGIMEGDPDTFVAYIKNMKEHHSTIMKQPAKTDNKKENNVSPDENSDFIVAEIRKYAALKEEGILTEEEFILKKKQLLGI